MSFSSDCKEELCRIPLGKPCCMRAELTALYMTAGTLSLLGNGRFSAQLSVESAAVARRIFQLLSRLYAIAPQVNTVQSPRFGGTRRCLLILSPAQSRTLLEKLSLMETDDSGSPRFRSSAAMLGRTTPAPTRACCCRAFLRGVMLGGGTLSDPAHGYHLELNAQDEQLRLMIAKCLQRFDLTIKTTRRRDTELIYLKQSEQIVTFLSVIGAHQAVMRMEDLRVRKQVLGTVNRAMNCDAANLNKQMRASERQLRHIEALMESERFAALPEKLQEIARARVAAPDASLEELGESMRPPVSKSAVNHRMRRLMAYCDEPPDINETE